MGLHEEIKKLREDFMRGELLELDVNPNPFLQFEVWLQQALEAKVSEVQAMTLCTVSSEGKPASRIVYLREFDNGKFWFYGNYNSRKAQNMEANPNVSLSFFWPDLQRQIRIEGTVKKCEAQFSDNYFNNRPRESKIGSWSSDQSSILKSRTDLDNLVKEYSEKFEGQEVPRPEFWGGWEVTANYYEFWQGRKSRLHDRISYRLENNNWKIERLAP